MGERPRQPSRLEAKLFADVAAQRIGCHQPLCHGCGQGPVQPSLMKVRDEVETLVGDGEVLLRVLQELGLHVWFRYEKYREEFSHEDVIVAIDETPVGVFVEIEGSENGIAAMAAALGRSADDYVVDSYRGLFLQHREEFGLTGPDMLFECVP